MNQLSNRSSGIEVPFQFIKQKQLANMLLMASEILHSIEIKHFLILKCQTLFTAVIRDNVLYMHINCKV